MRLLPRRPKVFISYRRKPGIDLASRIAEALKKQGVDVFQDVQNLPRGPYPENLLKALKERLFLPVLTLDTLNRCREDSDPNKPFDANDWVLKEIIYAYIYRHDDCIPVYSPDFAFADLKTFLPHKPSKWLGDQESVKIDKQHLFDASVDRITHLIEPRKWVRLLWLAPVRISIYTLLMLACLSVIGWFTLRNIFPPVLPLSNPINVLTAPGWLSTLIIRDVAVGTNNAWLATDNGLWVYRVDQNVFEPISSVTDDLFVVATDESGTVVWFALADTTNRTDLIGFYDDSIGTANFITPEIGNQPMEDSVLSIAVSADGTMTWVGTSTQGILQYTAGTWESILIRTFDFNPDIPIPANQIRAFPQDNFYRLWVTNFASVYRGANQSNVIWERINNSTTPQNDLFTNVTNIAVDQYGHLWVAHDTGVSILFEQSGNWNVQTNQWMLCTTSNSALVSVPVFSLSAGDGGRSIWLVSAGGLNVIEAPPQPQNCNQIQWYEWDATHSDDPFWTFSNQSETELRIAADPGISDIAWVFRQNSAQARIYDINP